MKILFDTSFIINTNSCKGGWLYLKVGDYTEEEFLREFVEERTEDEEYEMDSRKIAQVEESSGVDQDHSCHVGVDFKDVGESRLLSIQYNRTMEWWWQSIDYVDLLTTQYIGGTFLAGRQPDKEHLVRHLSKIKIRWKIFKSSWYSQIKQDGDK